MVLSVWYFTELHMLENVRKSKGIWIECDDIFCESNNLLLGLYVKKSRIHTLSPWQHIFTQKLNQHNLTKVLIIAVLRNSQYTQNYQDE